MSKICWDLTAVIGGSFPVCFVCGEERDKISQTDGGWPVFEPCGHEWRIQNKGRKRLPRKR